MIKIALIEPPYQFFRKATVSSFSLPLLWMMCLGTYLKEMMGKRVSIDYLDGQILSLQEILGKLKESKPQFIGLCPKYSSYENVLTIARFAKKLGSRVIMGGPHAGPLAREILLNRGSDSEDYCVDTIIRGDGEKALFEYISGKDPKQINNLVFVRGGKIIENPVDYLNLDELSMIDRDLIDVKPYFRLLKRENLKDLWPVFTHKGCFYGMARNSGCIFCGGDKNLRLKSSALFWREIDILVKKYKTSHIVNLADALPLDENFPWFKEFYTNSRFCKIKPRLSIRTLPRFINLDTVKILKELNVYSIRLPVTDIYPGCAFQMLQNSGEEKLKNLVQPFKLLSEAGMTVVTYFVPGAGRNTKEDIGKILELNRLISRLKNVHILSARGYLPFPGSRGWQMLLEKTGDKYRNRDLIDWKKVGLNWIKYFSDPKLMPMIKLIEDMTLTIGNE